MSVCETVECKEWAKYPELFCPNCLQDYEAMSKVRYQVICKDNFDRETVSDRVVAKEIPHFEEAKVMVDALNEKFSGKHSDQFFVVKTMAYVPYKWEP